VPPRTARADRWDRRRLREQTDCNPGGSSGSSPAGPATRSWLGLRWLGRRVAGGAAGGGPGVGGGGGGQGGGDRGEAGPPGLVAGAEAGAVVAVEVLVEQQQVAPVRVGPERGLRTVDRPATGLVGEEGAGEPSGEVTGHLVEVRLPPGSGRVL